MTEDLRAICGASAASLGAPAGHGHVGPCVLRADHDGPVHQDADGVKWTHLTPAQERDELRGLETRCALLHAAAETDPLVKEVAWKTVELIDAHRELRKRLEKSEAECAVLRSDCDEVIAAKRKVIQQGAEALGRAEKAEADIARVRAFVEGMRDWCSPYNVAPGYAARILEVLDEH